MWPDLVVSWPLYKFYIESNRDMEHLNIERKKFLLPIVKRQINEKTAIAINVIPIFEIATYILDFIFILDFRMYIVTFDSYCKRIYWFTYMNNYGLYTYIEFSTSYENMGEAYSNAPFGSIMAYDFAKRYSNQLWNSYIKYLNSP